jgi:hypothetical protein
MNVVAQQMAELDQKGIGMGGEAGGYLPKSVMKGWSFYLEE